MGKEKMNKRSFRTIAVMSVVLLLIMVLIPLFSENTLPPELEAFNETQLESYSTFVYYFAFAILSIWLAANIGLVFFARWARPIFAICVIADTVAALFMGGFAVTALESFVTEASLLLSGFVIALSYFSDVSVCFEQKGG